MVKAIINCSSLCHVPGDCPLLSAAGSSRRHESRQISSGILNSFILASRRSLGQLDQGKQHWGLEGRGRKEPEAFHFSWDTNCFQNTWSVTTSIVSLTYPAFALHIWFYELRLCVLSKKENFKKGGKTSQNRILISLSVQHTFTNSKWALFSERLTYVGLTTQCKDVWVYDCWMTLRAVPENS